MGSCANNSIPVHRPPPLTVFDQPRYQTDQYENPYHLHHNDHAGLVLVFDRLATASDFHSWKRSVWMALNVQNKLGFVDGSITKPALDHRDYGTGHAVMTLLQLG